MIKKNILPVCILLTLFVGGFFQPGSANYLIGFDIKNNLQPKDTLTVCAGAGVCDYESIQAAINAANPGDIIELASETFTESITIDENVYIVGAGPQDTIIQSAINLLSSTSRVIMVPNGVTALLEGVTVRYGSSDEDGGGILNHGNLTIENVLIANNDADSGGGIANISMSGNATLIINRSVIRNNNANARGGGILNSAPQNGQSSSLQLINSTIAYNDSFHPGGGIANFATLGNATAEISNSTVSENTSENGGGGIHNQKASGNASLIIQQTTINGNAATPGSNLYLQNGSIDISQSILANGIGGDDCLNETGIITDNLYNLVEDGSCGFPIGGDPHVFFLGDYGGPTPTNALQSDSQALDRVPRAQCASSSDQRGMPRPYGAGCDIGAFELHEQSLNFTQNVSDNSVEPGQTITFKLEIDPIGPGISNGTIVGQMSDKLTFQDGSIILVPPDFGTVGLAPPVLAQSVIITANYTATLTMPAQVVQGLPAGTLLLNRFSITSTEIITPMVTTATLTVINVPPIAVDDSGTGFITNPNHPFTTGNVLDNDYDPNGDEIIYLSSTTGNLLGSIEYNDDGTFDYDPGYAFEELPPGAIAYDQFTYSITDGVGGIVNATVTITIRNNGFSIFLPLTVK